MGSTDSIPQINTQRLNRDNWQTLPQQQIQSHFPEYGQYLQLKNNMTGEELDQYEIIINGQDDYIQYKNVYNLRNRYDCLVQIAFLNQLKTKQLCSIAFNLQVYIQHFPMRLCDIKQIPFPQNLYILERALVGFSILYQMVGNFHINQDLIVINQQGIVKVWLNSNLSKHFVQNISNSSFHSNFRAQNQSNNQNSMVWSLLTMVQQITNYSTLQNGHKLIEYFGYLNKSQLSFIQALSIVRQYANVHKTQIPEMLQTLIKIMRQNKGIFDSQVDINFNYEDKQAVSEVSLFGNPHFKQSKVQRVHGFKNTSVRSNVGSESNHTFADKLKSFDKANRNTVNGFGKASQLKEATPIKQKIEVEYQQKQPLTERIIVNQLSFSSISSPPQAYSLTVLSPSIKFGQNIINSKNNSQIIPDSTKNPLALSQSPVKQTKPMTYFSQYISQNEPIITKKQTLFSFRQDEKRILMGNQSNQKLLKDAIVTMSLQNSKNSKVDIISNKPIVKFTYNNINQTSHATPVPQRNQITGQQSIIQKLMSHKPQQSFDQNQLPISPPSVEKSSMVSHAKKLSSDFVKEQIQENKSSREPQKLLKKYFQKKNTFSKRLNTVEKQQQNQMQENRIEEVQENFENIPDSPRFISKKIKVSYQNYSKKQEQPPNTQKQQIKVKPDIQLIKGQIQQVKNPQFQQQTKKINTELKIGPKIQISQQKLLVLQNQFDIDPQIASDLLRYEQIILAQNQKGKNFS